MFKLRYVVLSLVLVLVFSSVRVVAQQEKQKSADSLCIPAGALKLAPLNGVESKRSSVEFPHFKHFTYNCQECHHTWDLGAEVAGCMTSGCHDLTQTPKNSEETDAIRYYKKAFHQKCIGCHRAIKKQNFAVEKKASLDGEDIKIQNAGPTGCINCHPKE